MKHYSWPQKIGLCLFICMAFIACYVIQNYGSTNTASEQTYGDYVASTQITSTKSNTSGDSKDVEQENSAAQDEVVKKVIYLTFDDGPSDNTIKILEILKENNIKATFFVVGEQITPEREELIKSMIADGHQIGVHTYTHERNQIYASKEACLFDFKKTYERLVDVTGVAPTVYRFPYGSANCYISSYCNSVIREMDALGLAYIDWNVSGEDAIGHPTTDSILKNVKGYKKYNEPVVLLHDGASNDLTVQTLPAIIKSMKAAGYEFDIIANRYKPYQWSHKWRDS